MNPRHLTAAALASLALAAAGCGDDNDSGSASGDTTTTEQAPATSTETATQTEGAAPAGDASAPKVSNATDLKSKPKIARPAGSPPAQLVKKDLVVGKGPKAKAGDTLSVQYVGVSFSSGKQFDASWDNGGQAFTFPLGGGQVIPGWDNGLVGMQKGGRRELVIPPDQGYGAQGSPPDILPNETLVFVVDLENIG